MTDFHDPLNPEPEKPERSNGAETPASAEILQAGTCSHANPGSGDPVSEGLQKTGTTELRLPKYDPRAPKDLLVTPTEPEGTGTGASPTAQAPKQTNQPYTYRWSYEAQAAYDKKELKKRRGRGAAAYAAIMALAFLLCLGVLTVVLVMNATSTGYSLSTAEIAENVNPGTVLIYAANSQQYGYGTGFFVRSDGYIVTNNHVVQGADTISVMLYNGMERTARTVWSSATDDLAILKIDGNHYPTLTIGNSDAIQVGDRAVAIGNPAGSVCPWTVTQGIISSAQRQVTVEESGKVVDLMMIQTDALVNPGNSGGPLCNDRGEVIGIVTRKMTDYEGVGLAIPINGAMELVNAYFKNGHTENVVSAVSRVRPALGIQAEAVKKGDKITGSSDTAPCDGVRVTSITEGSAASRTLKRNDIITEINGESVTTVEGMRSKLYQYRAGDTIKLTVARGEELITVTVKLDAAKAS